MAAATLRKLKREGNRRPPTPDAADPQDGLTWPGPPPTKGGSNR
jgi:hypothetical protein